MVFDLVQKLMPVVFLPIHVFHGLSDLCIADCGKTEGAGKGRRCIGISRGQGILVAYLIEIFSLRSQSGNRYPIYVISGGYLGRNRGGAEHGGIFKFRVIGGCPVNLSGLAGRREPGQVYLLLAASHIC